MHDRLVYFVHSILHPCFCFPLSVKVGYGCLLATTYGRTESVGLLSAEALTAALVCHQQAITQYYSESSKIPDILQQLQQQYKPGEPTESSAAAIESHAVKVAEAGLAAFGLMVQFLKDNMLDKALLPNAKFESLCDGVSDRVQ